MEYFTALSKFIYAFQSWIQEHSSQWVPNPYFHEDPLPILPTSPFFVRCLVNMLKVVPIFSKTHPILPTLPFYRKKPGGKVPTMRSPVTFQTKFYVTTVDSFQPLPIFCHKELHLWCHIGLELNIVTSSTKTLKAIRGHPLHD